MKKTTMNVPTKLKFYKDVILIYNSGTRDNYLGALLGAERTGLRGGEEKELEFSWLCHCGESAVYLFIPLIEK